MAKRNVAQFCLSILVIICVFHENVMVEGAKVSHTRALKKGTTDLPTVRRQQVQFRRASCNCSGVACECTVRVNLVQINFNQLASIRIYYNPAEVSLNLDVTLNGRVIYHTALSARNPPPFCMPVPQLPVVMLCVRLYDIRLGNNSIRACVNFEVQLVNNPILVVSFDCIRVGANGVGIEKPSPSALVDSPDPVIAADDTNVLAYSGSDKPVSRPDSAAEFTTFSDSNNNLFPTTPSLSDKIDDFNEQTTESSIPVTTIASIDIVTLLTARIPQEPVFLNSDALTHQTATQKGGLFPEADTEQNISPFTTQVSTYTTVPSNFPNTGNSYVSENSDVFDYTNTQLNAAHSTKRPSGTQTSLLLEQNTNPQSTLAVTDTYIIATEDITHTAEVSTDIDIVINKVKTLATSSDKISTMSPVNIHTSSNPSVKSE